MKNITSAVLGLSLTLAVAGLSFAQTPAQTPAPATARDSASATAPAKTHVKKHKKAVTNTNAKPAATTTTPAAK
jgi:hypothetical protein